MYDKELAFVIKREKCSNCDQGARQLLNEFISYICGYWRANFANIGEDIQIDTTEL